MKKNKLFIFKVLILNILMYIISLFLSPISLETMLSFNFNSDNFNIIQSLTSMFLHGDFSHLFFNMLVLFLFGYNIEYSIGTKNIIVLYFLSGIGSWLLASTFQSIPSIGSSGAISGIMASNLVLFPNKKISILFLPIQFKLKWLIFIYFIIELYKSFVFQDDGISHLSHVGGFIGGYLYSLYLKNLNKIGIKF